MEHTFDSKYEFNAPKYVDFLQGDIDQDTDKWFDEKKGDEGGIEIDIEISKNNFQNAWAAINEFFSSEKQNSEKQDNSQPEEQENSQPEEQGNSQPEEQGNSQPEEQENSQPEEQKSSNIRTNWNEVDGKPFVKRSLSKRSCSNQLINYSDSKKRKRISEDSMTKLSKQEIPSFVRKLPEKGNGKIQSSEEMQLDKIKRMQKQTRERSRKNERLMKQALQAGQYMPVKSVEITIPKLFNFECDKRVKSHGMETRSEKWEQDSTSNSFQSQLRKHNYIESSHRGSETIVKPFKFALPDKASVLPNKKWESMAQSTMNYQTKTPERFRTKPKVGDGNNKNIGSTKREPPKLTVPITPQLMTRTRARQSTISSQIEEKLPENYQFKATEFDPRIVEKQGMFGVKKCADNAKNKKTEILPFSFESRDKERLKKKEEKIKEILEMDKANRQFHAMDSSVIRKEPFKPTSSSKPLTVVQDVVLNTDVRAKERMKFEEWKCDHERRIAEVKMRIEQEKLKREEEQLKQMRKDAVHKAQPFRNYKPMQVQKSSKPLTDPETPNFSKHRSNLRV